MMTQKLAVAENAATLNHLTNINTAADEPRFWRASAWMLERLHPDTFGKSTPDAVAPPQLAALNNIPGEVIDAATLDGATGRQRFADPLHLALGHRSVFKEREEAPSGRWTGT